MRFLGALSLTVAAGACFATRNDVRILQADVLAARTEATRADSARARQLVAILASTNSLSTFLASLSDSVRDLNLRLGRYQGVVTQDLLEIRAQLIQVQELTGQSGRRLGELRADLEAKARQTVPAPMTPAAGDTTKAPVPAAAPMAPGPSQLFVLGMQQKEQRSWATARAAFEELLKRYPQDDQVPEAQYWIGEIYSFEGRATEADSVFQIVVSKYPRSVKASTSMYKLAQSLDRQKKCLEAKAMMDNVVRQYPQSDEAVRAREWRCVIR